MQTRIFLQSLPHELLSVIASFLNCNEMEKLHQTSSIMRNIVNETPTTSVRFFDKKTSSSMEYVTQGKYENISKRLKERYRIILDNLGIEERGVTNAPIGGVDMGGQPNELVNLEKQDYLAYGIMLLALLGYALKLVADNKSPTGSSYTVPFLLFELAVILLQLRDNGNRYDKLWAEKQQLNEQLKKINEEFTPKLMP
jgi:hypothetical protein